MLIIPIPHNLIQDINFKNEDSHEKLRNIWFPYRFWSSAHTEIRSMIGNLLRFFKSQRESEYDH